MKRILFATAALAIGAAGMNAQNVIERNNLADNWSLGVDAGVTTPLKGHSFFQNMRGQYGLHLEKQISPLVGFGVEGRWGVNTTDSRTAFDTQYVGAYGTLNFNNLFGGFSCTPRPVNVDAVVGAGWLHQFGSHHDGDMENAMAAKFGLDFDFRVSDHFSIAIKPAVLYNLTGTKTQLDARRATFEALVGLNYNFGPGFKCVTVPVDRTAEVAALNEQVNALRADLEGTAAALAATTAQNAELATALDACMNQAPKVVVDTTNTLNSVRYVFFKIGSSTITADQQPNVEMIAAYLNNHPGSTVLVKGYASQDGPIEVNERLAQQRAESVKTALVKRYKINPDRIKAEGEGIGHMFSEESWN
ncbi:MAG: OmpA family protein, partial [Duncaniella sp.]|nr:OmpA family protein [Duncaniella sp.]